MNSNKLFKYIGIAIVMLLVCMTFFTPIPSTLKLVIRIFFLIVFFILWRYFSRRNQIEAKDLSFALLALNLAFLIAMPFTPDFWNLNQETSEGFALIKLSDSFIISSVIIVSFLLAGYTMKNLYLTKGRLIAGLVTGILFFLLFGYLALNNPQQKPEAGFVSKNWLWVLLFVIANGFMEELIFRGALLERLNAFFKPFWSILLTSVCFAAPHLTVIYQPNAILFSGITFLLGMICGYAMQYTKSIIAPMLIHAGADLMIIIPVFATYGVSG
jgi:membrane protease YdiL (CAAX protease family)